MTLRQMEIFLNLAQNPHLGKVAESIGLTQSAVSMAIKSLEETLETKLFDRLNKKLILNEYGRLFYKKVEPLVKELSESENLFRDETFHGELKVGVSSSIANYIIPQIIYNFQEKYKGVVIKMATGNTKEVGILIENGKVDMGFVEGEFNSVDVVKEVLGEDELYVVTGDKELVRDGKYEIEELLNKKWILREKGSGTREIFLSHLGDYTKRLNIFMELDHTGGVKSVLMNKNTLSCLSQYSVRKEMNGGILHRLHIKDFRFTRSFYTIWHRNKILSPMLKEFIEAAKHYKH
ncbi:LysR family transcriptional regulator [bacterium]|nr:LysR family transcriptional regulator [bacterium]